MLILLAFFIISKPESCSAFNIRRIFMRDAKEKTIEGYLHDKIYLRSRVKVPCFGKRDPPKGVKSFFWEHSGKNLSDNEKYGVDGDGALTINDVSLGDAGVFFCRTNTTRGMKSIKHMIEVVQIPYTSLQIFIFYEVKYCNERYELLAKGFVESKLKGNICFEGECRITLIRGACHFDDAIPSLQVEVLITFPKVPDGSCDVTCTRQRSKDLPMQVSKYVANIMKKNKLKILDEKEISTSNYYEKNDMICDTGFEMKESATSSLCVPCKPGYFFDKGYCIPCPYNQYTEQYGAKQCRPCGKFLKTIDRGANSKLACHITESRFLLLAFVVLLISLPILFIMVILCWCIRCCTKRTVAASKNGSTCHKRKSKHHHKHFDVQSSSESEMERKSRSITIVSKSRGHPKSSKNDSNYHQVEMVGDKEKRSAKTRGNIPPPPPLPTASAMKRVARNFKGR